MKNLLVVLALVFGSAFAVAAQTPTTSQTANEGFVGYSFVRQNFETLTVDDETFNFNDSTDSHGVNAAYTRYFGGKANKAGVVGITGDLGFQFGSERGNRTNLVTLMGGVTAKARNSKYVQPYVRGLAGVARQGVNIDNFGDYSDWSSAFALGGGVDFNVKKYSRYKVRVGVDYLNTGFAGERQNNLRFTTGLVF